LHRSVSHGRWVPPPISRASTPSGVSPPRAAPTSGNPNAREGVQNPGRGVGRDWVPRPPLKPLKPLSFQYRSADAPRTQPRSVSTKAVRRLLCWCGVFCVPRANVSLNSSHRYLTWWYVFPRCPDTAGSTADLEGSGPRPRRRPPRAPPPRDRRRRPLGPRTRGPSPRTGGHRPIPTSPPPGSSDHPALHYITRPGKRLGLYPRRILTTQPVFFVPWAQMKAKLFPSFFDWFVCWISDSGYRRHLLFRSDTVMLCCHRPSGQRPSPGPIDIPSITNSSIPSIRIRVFILSTVLYCASRRHLSPFFHMQKKESGLFGLSRKLFYKSLNTKSILEYLPLSRVLSGRSCHPSPRSVFFLSIRSFQATPSRGEISKLRKAKYY